MLDKSSRQFIRYLKDNDGFVLLACGVEYPDGIDDDGEFWAMIHFLQEQGRITYNPENTCISLTYTSRKSRDFSLIALERYMIRNWIAIAALIVSIIALFRSCPADRSRPEPPGRPQAIFSMSSSEISNSP